MGIGNDYCDQARQTDLKRAIFIGLDEAMTALEESFYDLTDEQVWGFAFEGRHNITAIVMHCQKNLDEYACKFQTGKTVLDHEDRFDLWVHGPAEVRADMTGLPTAAIMRDRLHTLREAAMAGLELAGAEDLLGPRHCRGQWVEQGKTAADAYMRTIMHTMSHVRQVWLMRGAMGLADTDGWPEQHWA
ncbi:MAG: hypothetical protein ACYTFO_01105 [Planctomycetota bacterium]|jgi:hypothetical protein